MWPNFEIQWLNFKLNMQEIGVVCSVLLNFLMVNSIYYITVVGRDGQAKINRANWFDSVWIWVFQCLRLVSNQPTFGFANFVWLGYPCRQPWRTIGHCFSYICFCQTIWLKSFHYFHFTKNACKAMKNSINLCKSPLFTYIHKIKLGSIF